MTFRIWSFLLVVVTACGPAANGQNPMPLRQRTTPNRMSSEDVSALRRSLTEYNDGNAQHAKALLESLAEKYPGCFEADETLGLIYFEAGDRETGLGLLKKAAALEPRSAMAQANLGTAYLRLNRAQDAIVSLQHSVALDPKNAEAYSALGQALLMSRRPSAAAKVFSLAASRQPGDSATLYNWALALFNAGRPQQAGAVLSRISNGDALAYVQSLFGDVEEKQGHFENAVKHLTQAAKLDPSEANVFALGLEFARHWTFEGAIRVYGFGVNKYPESFRLQLGLGVSRYASGEYAGAAPIFSHLLAANPDSSLYADLLGRACSVIAEQQDTGCATLLTFAEHHPENAMASTLAAATILKRPDGERDTDLARRLLNQATRADPKSADANLQLAVLEQQELHWEDSIATLARVIALSPHSSEGHYRLARAYWHVDRAHEAELEIGLQRKYSQANTDALNARLKGVTTFLISLR